MTRHLTVVPVVDYEPPPLGGPLSALPLHQPAPRRRSRQGPSPGDRTSACAAAAFADAALRGVLEVADGRRPLAQLRPLLVDKLVDTVVALTRSSQNGQTAKLGQVRLRIVDRDGDAAEVFATYQRGDRVHAIAGRVERAAVRGRRRWRLVALHVG